MSDLFSSDALEEGYRSIYETLAELRERFHRQGRLDDSNAKLDEIAKYFAAYLAYKNGAIDVFPEPASRDLTKGLQRAFAKTVKLPQYEVSQGRSIFGTNPTLNLREGDEDLAREL